MNDTPEYQDPPGFDHVLDAIRAADILEAAKLFRHCLIAAYALGQTELAQELSDQKVDAPNDTEL